MPKGKKKKIEVETPQESFFNVHLQLGSESFEAKGATLNEAVNILFEKCPPQFKTFGRLSYVSDKGKQTFGLRLLPFHLQRYKFRPDWRGILVKRLAVSR